MITLLLFSLLLLTTPTLSLHAEEAGIVDFHIPTSGHGVTTSASFTNSSILTSSASSCYFSSRHFSGEFRWRRNGCSESHLSEMSWLNYSKKIYTLDERGVLRVWDEENGELLIEDVLEKKGGGMLLGHDEGVVVKREDAIVIWKDGETKGEVEMMDFLGHKGKLAEEETGRILDVVSSAGGELWVVAGWIMQDEMTSVESLALGRVRDGEVGKLSSFKKGDDAKLKSSSVKLWGQMVAALSEDDKTLIVASEERSEEISAENFDLDKMEELEVIANDTFLSIVGKNDRGERKVALALTTPGGSVKPIKMSVDGQPVAATAVAICPHEEKSTVYTAHQSNDSFTISTHSLPDHKHISSFQVPHLSPSLNGHIHSLFPHCFSPHILLSTSSSTTSLLLHSNPLFTHEEALSSITNAIFFDYSTPDDTHKNKLFGFHKLAMILSSAGRVFGIDTAVPHKGEVLYTVLLPQKANKYWMVYGGFSSQSGVHGAFSQVKKSSQVLFLGLFEETVDWVCVNGITGKVISEGSVEVGEEVLNVIPFIAESGQCLQMAMLLLKDDTFHLVPETIPAQKELKETVNLAKNGMFVHSVDKHTGEFKSFQIEKENDNLQLNVAGSTIFPPDMERIVSVNYPTRGEVVQSPATILGDDSLLLKYLNPHLAVVVTESTSSYLQTQEETEETSESFFSMLSTATPAKKKPLGVKPTDTTSPSPTTPTPSTPTLFINLIDTTSSKLLHRLSHSHKTSTTPPSQSSDIPVIISENWILYSYFNHKTKRSELGVLTLHDGMIDKTSISLFKSPEQELEFSSFTSHKPIVLHKVYTLGKRVTGIGVTQTARGISSKNFLLMLGDVGNLFTVDARWLDPRRPGGEPKQTEKMEGLMKYSPIIPILPHRIPSYTQMISNGTKIVTSPTNVESQSLVLVVGGPDLFFTRLAPSKGFDLLPDSFNKGLLSVVVLGLLGVLGVVKRIGKKKMVKMAWA